MLENKKLNMVISLLIAIALWAFVIGEINPQATRVYRDVPIRILHEEILTENGLAVYSVSDRVMSVTLTGTRSEINKIDTKDITASVDLENAVMGQNQVRIDVRIPSKVDIESQSIDRVTVHIEQRVSKEIPVEVFYQGTFSGEEEPITVELDIESVVVSGAATTVDQVSAAVATVEEGTVTEEPKEFTCDLIAVNRNGQRVYNVDLSDSSVLITSELVKLKTVPLAVSLEGEDSEDIKRTVKAPKEVTIKGKSSDLEDIESITTETVYLDKILASTTVPLVPILPEGIDLSKESEDLSMTVQVTEIKSKTLSFSEQDIELRNLPDGLQAAAEAAAIKVDVTGSEAVLDSLTEDNVTLFADLTDLQAGKHKVELTSECSAEGILMSVSPKRITIVVEKADMESEPEEGAAEDDAKHDDNTIQNENNEE